MRASLGLDEVNRRVRESLSTLADVALEIAMEKDDQVRDNKKIKIKRVKY